MMDDERGRVSEATVNQSGHGTHLSSCPNGSARLGLGVTVQSAGGREAKKKRTYKQTKSKQTHARVAEMHLGGKSETFPQLAGEHV